MRQLTTAPPPNGTLARDVGRTLNGSVTGALWISAPVELLGDAAWAGGFPFNLAARADLSQGGDSGGPIFLAEPAPARADGAVQHVLAGLVDTDICPAGCEHKGNFVPAVDLFARADLIPPLALLAS